MREQLQARLEVLKAEWAAGQLKLRALELRQLRLREVLLRLRGGIQALEDLLGQTAPEQRPPSAGGDPHPPVALEPEGGPGTQGGGPP